MKKRIYVDMDNVLCDFSKAYLAKKSEEYFYPQAHFGFFKNLEPIENAIKSFRILEKYYDVWILTSPSIYNPLSYSEKREWVEQHLGFDTCRKLILSPDKSLFKGEYLIDDNIHDGFEGEHLHFGKGNQYPDWDSIIFYLLPDYNKTKLELLIENLGNKIISLFKKLK